VIVTGATFLIRFENCSERDANVFAEQLLKQLTQVKTEGMEIKRQRENDDSQDPGTILAVILGATATVEIAKGIAEGIAAWLRSRNRASISITTKDGKREAKNLNSAHVAQIAEILMKGSK
jgi:hypothetical protein